MAKKEGRVGDGQERDFEYDPDKKTLAAYGEWTPYGAKSAIEEKDDASLKSVKLFREDDKAGRGSPGSAGSSARGE